MPYPTGSFAIRLEEIDRSLVGLKAYAGRVASTMGAENVPASFVFSLHAQMRDRVTALNAIRTYAQSHPDFVAYVRDQKGDATLDVAAAFMSVIAAAGEVADAIEAGFPKDASGYLLARTWGPSGPEDRTFTPAQMSTVRTKLAALIAAID